MEEKSLIEAINFFNNISVEVEDITTSTDRKNANKVVKATFDYNGQQFVTQPLYYKEISNLQDVKDIKWLHRTFGNDVFWLDINKHQWPKVSSHSDLDSTVIDDILPNKNDKDFQEFLMLLANNNQTGYIQKITSDGRPSQYYHNLENNNHWHDLVLWIKDAIKTNGKQINKRFFQHLIFKWNNGKRTSLYRNPDYKIVRDMNNNIKAISPVMDLIDNKKVLEYKKQIILQGPPGTGKTRRAKKIALEMLGLTDEEELKENDNFKLIQFHPSYTYEDFVRGIIAESKGGNIEYKSVNKTLGDFAEKALENYQRVTNTKPLDDSFPGKLKSLLNEIRASIDKGEDYGIGKKSKAQVIAILEDGLLYSFPKREEIKYKLLFSDIEKVYLAKEKIKKPTDLDALESKIGLSMKGKFPYYFMILEKLKKIEGQMPEITKEEETLEKYILIIDEINRANLSTVLGELIYALEYRGEVVESIYDVDGKKELILPPNLYIIGTMNTADRSVGHIDYAIRRRFAFVPMYPKDLSNDNSIIFNSKLFREVENLFDMFLSDEFEKEDVQIGHSYFIDKSDEGGTMDIRLKYEIKPILIEYVRDGVLKKKAEREIESLTVG